MKKMLKFVISVMMSTVLTVTAASNCFGELSGFNYTVEVPGGIIRQDIERIVGPTGAVAYYGKIVEVDKTIKAIPSNTFNTLTLCPFLGEVIINKIDVGTFANCTELEYANLYNFYRKIESCAFENCTSLRRIYIYGVDKIADDAFKGCDKEKLVIYCEKDSYAEEYAKKNGFKYDYMPDKIKGDINYDGVVSAKDCADLLQYMINPEASEDKYLIADYVGAGNVNSDRAINTADVAHILQKSLDSSYLMPCEDW